MKQGRKGKSKYGTVRERQREESWVGNDYLVTIGAYIIVTFETRVQSVSDEWFRVTYVAKPACLRHRRRAKAMPFRTIHPLHLWSSARLNTMQFFYLLRQFECRRLDYPILPLSDTCLLPIITTLAFLTRVFRFISADCTCRIFP